MCLYPTYRTHAINIKTQEVWKWDDRNKICHMKTKFVYFNIGSRPTSLYNVLQDVESDIIKC